VLFMLTYLSAGVGGTLMSCLLNAGSVSVGASGALVRALLTKVRDLY